SEFKTRIGVRFPSLVSDVWTSAEFPVQYIGVRRWREMFNAAGFVSDTGLPAPEKPLTVWRGAANGRGRGMSWTRDYDKAVWFASREALWGEHNPAVYEATVPPRAVLAMFMDPEGRKESEVVVNPFVRWPLKPVEYVANGHDGEFS